MRASIISPICHTNAVKDIVVRRPHQSWVADITYYETIDDARGSTKCFIEEMYNKKRLHSSLGYKPPEEFEEGWLKQNEKRGIV